MSLLPSGSDIAPGAVFQVSESSQVGEARRAATELARRLGFDETEGGKVALVVTEAATNLVKHAGGGELCFVALKRRGICGLEVLALDRGPGMSRRRILPARRLFDVGHARHRNGGNRPAVRLFSRSILFPRSAPSYGLDCGPDRLHSTHRPGESRSASFTCQSRAKRSAAMPGPWNTGPTTSLVLVADGLGHGPLAADAAREAVRVFREHAELDPVEIVHRIHSALRSTRGAAVAVAELNPRARNRYASSGWVISPGPSSLRVL